MKKYICIHGHFYQPPRENAWLETIEEQESAKPFHDWNQRITAECYGPNAWSRILDSNNNITNIVNNYTDISFNFGPTLLDWMQKESPDVYAQIIQADYDSRALNNGHGAAMAQVYNHIIMPLANAHDKQTQVVWGIADFEKRFNRKPEGMWLAETAVDTATLECLASNGILFTVLAPRQAKSVKPINQGVWADVSGEKIDTTQPYLCRLPSGKSIALFFYNGTISQDVAFKGLLKDGKQFAEHLQNAFTTTDTAQLIHIATDGESYGHHHKHGDMALAFAIKELKESSEVAITNYGNFLAMFPPTMEVQIFENSSWSCEHGVERWRNNCGCNTGGNHTWNQKWRAPLRQALDWLSEQLSECYQTEMQAFTPLVWEIRNTYIDVILHRTETEINQLITNFCKQEISSAQRTKIIRLLEMQRHSLLMFTSCGWFFDEVSGIETIQILQYAERAIQLAESECKLNLQPPFLELLQQVPSNVEKYNNAAVLYSKEVMPSRLTLGKVGVHYAVSSLFDEYPESLIICNYKAESEIFERLEAGLFKLAVGKTKVNSLITFSEKEFCFAVLYLGQNHIIGNYAGQMPEDQFEAMHQEITAAFSESRIADVIGIMQSYFGADKFSLDNLLKDEKRKILSHIIQKDIAQAEESYKKIYNRNYNSMNVLRTAGLSIPPIFMLNLETVLNNEIRNFFNANRLYPARLKKLALEVSKWNIKLEKQSIAYVAEARLYNLVHELHSRYSETKFIEMIISVINSLNQLKIELQLSKLQNEYFIIAKNLLENNSNNNETDWMSTFKDLGLQLNITLQQPVTT